MKDNPFAFGQSNHHPIIGSGNVARQIVSGQLLVDRLLTVYRAQSGFDNRTAANRYDASLRSDPPFTMNPGDSLISTISLDTIGLPRVMLN